MKRALLTILAGLVVSGVSAHLSWGNDTADDVKKAGVLVVGIRDDAPPFGFIDSRTGALVGVDADLASAVAKRLGVKLELRTVTASTWIQDLVNAKVDLVAATLIRTPDRAKVADFSLPYFMASQRILARKGSVSSLSDLEGKRIGTSQGQASAESIKGAVPSASCYFFSDPAKAVEALRRGEIDAISASGATLYGCASALQMDPQQKDEYEISKTVTISEDGFRMATRRGNPKLLEIVNSTIVDLKDTGGGQKILDKWFRKDGGGTAGFVPSGAPKATGIVSRSTPTPKRFLVLPESGTFRPSSAVLVLDPQGHPVGSGVVSAVFEDEVYVDTIDVPPGVVHTGFVITMNYTGEESRRFVADHQDLIEKVKAATRVQEEQQQKEIGRAAEADKQERTKYQEDMAKTKMQLDYQYSNDYYSYYGYPFFGYR